MRHLFVFGAIKTGAVLAGAITWSLFHSAINPYTLSQPSSFAHVVLQRDGHNVDYFFPALGSFVTSVSVSGVHGRRLGDEAAYLRSSGGHHVHRSGWIRVARRLYPLLRADFYGLVGHWQIDMVSFRERGRIWQLTASYDVHYRSMRSVMLRMLNSFRFREAGTT